MSYICRLEMTPKQHQFAREIVLGKSQADVYRAAYNTLRMNDNVSGKNILNVNYMNKYSCKRYSREIEQNGV